MRIEIDGKWEGDDELQRLYLLDIQVGQILRFGRCWSWSAGPETGMRLTIDEAKAAVLEALGAKEV